jgi:hypothetical protein
LVSIPKRENHFKNPLEKLRGEFLQEGFYLVKGRSFETGEGISNLENAS